MAKLNVPSSNQTIQTHEGASAKHINPELQLRRSVMSCLLWENEFYEDGETIANRIAQLIPKVKPETVMSIAIEARENMKLRHVPLLIVREMSRLEKYKPFVSKTLSRIIQRPDELTEFCSIYWKDGKQTLSAQVKKGLAEAFTKFDSYQLAKYNQDNTIKLRDVLFLCHAKPKDKEQEQLWKQLVDNELETPDTWEVALSATKDKKAEWERLLSEKKLGGLALLRNLRNMNKATVNDNLIISALNNMNVERILPFRFITAARYTPQLEPSIESAMLKCLDNTEKIDGKTILLIDVSGSMDSPISDKSELTRMDAACGLAILAREITNADVFTFSDNTVRIPARHGFALRDAIVQSQTHGGTYLGGALEHINKMSYDRLIIFTDEQSHDSIGNQINGTKGYVVNVASNENGIGYGKWIHIDGFSEAILTYIREYEKLK